VVPEERFFDEVPPTPVDHSPSDATDATELDQLVAEDEPPPPAPPASAPLIEAHASTRFEPAVGGEGPEPPPERTAEAVVEMPVPAAQADSRPESERVLEPEVASEPEPAPEPEDEAEPEPEPEPEERAGAEAAREPDAEAAGEPEPPRPDLRDREGRDDREVGTAPVATAPVGSGFVDDIPAIPPLPTDPGIVVDDEPIAAVIEEVVHAEEPPPTHVPAHARGTENGFSERAQIAISRLDDFPASNGARTPRPLPRVVAIANQKGGVGKTTTTVNLGAALSELDYRVLVVDLDPQGNATSGLGIDTRNFESSMYDVIMRDAPIEDCIEPTSVQNLFVTPATIDLAGVEIELVSAFSRELKLKRAIDTVVDDFDFVLIDCPPSLGLLTVNGLAAATEVLVPIQCEYYALEGLSQLLRNVQLVASNLNTGLEVSTIVLTMFDARTRLAIDVADEVRSHFREIVCRSIIPRTVRLSEAPSFGQPITVFDPSSRGAVAYRELAKEVSNGAPKRSG
jgi:chromosome partitioning protein